MQMQLSEVKIAGNFRPNEYLIKKLMNSLVIDGQMKAIKVNHAGYVIDGRHRVEALRRLDRDTVEVTIIT